MDTLALTFPTWDITTDAQGNWATFGDATPASDQTGPGMRLAQDVATRCLSWKGEVYYDTTQGIRFDQIMGEFPNLPLLQSSFNTEALKVPLCQTALADFSLTAGATRQLTGTLNVADVAGNSAAVQLF